MTHFPSIWIVITMINLPKISCRPRQCPTCHKWTCIFYITICYMVYICIQMYYIYISYYTNLYHTHTHTVTYFYHVLHFHPFRRHRIHQRPGPPGGRQVISRCYGCPPLTASLDGEGWVETEGYVDMPFQGLRLRPFGKLIVCYGKWPHL